MDFNCLLITGSSLETNKDSVINVLNLLVYLPKTKKPWAHPPSPPPPPPPISIHIGAPKRYNL